MRTKLRHRTPRSARGEQGSNKFERETLRLHTLLDTVNDGIHVLDATGLLVEANHAFLKMLGLNPSAIGSLHVSDWDVRGKSISKADLQSLRGMPTGKVFEAQHRHADGHVIDVEINACGVKFVSGQMLYCISRDMTERKRIELDIQNHQIELREMVAEAVAKVQELSIELMTSEARERRQISEDLHDNLGQNLALVRFKLRSLTAQDDGMEESDEMRQLRDIATSVERAIQSVRSLTTQLWPPVLYKFGLLAALEWLAGEMEIHNGLHVCFKQEPLAVVDEVTNIILFRAVRELLNNVWKHAQVSRTELSASMDGANHRIMLRVADNGVGFNVEQMHSASPDNSFGLLSVCERIKLIGGTVDVQSQPGQGAAVTILLPVPAHAA